MVLVSLRRAVSRPLGRMALPTRVAVVLGADSSPRLLARLVAHVPSGHHSHAGDFPSLLRGDQPSARQNGAWRYRSPLTRAPRFRCYACAAVAFCPWVCSSCGAVVNRLAGALAPESCAHCGGTRFFLQGMTVLDHSAALPALEPSPRLPDASPLTNCERGEVCARLLGQKCPGGRGC